MNPPAARGRSARLWRVTAAVVAGLLIAAALLLGALRLALAQVPGHAARIQAWIEKQTDLRIQYGALDARMRWFGPEIVLRDVRVLDRDGTQALFATEEGSVGLDLWNFFRTGEFVAGRVKFVGPDVTVVRLADGRIRLLGQSERPSDRPPFDLDRLPAGRVEITDATVTYRDQMSGDPPLTLTRLTMALRRQHGHVGIAGSGRLPASLGTRIDFTGRLKGSLDRYDELDARVEVQVDRLLLPGLEGFLPGRTARPLAGAGPVTAVVAVAGGRLTHARLDLDLENVNLRLPERHLPTVEAFELSAPEHREGTPPTSLPVVEKTTVQRPAAAGPSEVRYVRLAGSFRLRRQDDTWTFRAQDVDVRVRDGQRKSLASVSGTWRGQLLTTFALGVSADQLRIADAWPLVLAVAPAGFDRFAALNPAGEVRSLRADVSRDRAGAWPRFSVSAAVEGLSVSASGRAPGIVGVSGVLSGTDERGRFALRSKSLYFDWPRLFREPIAGIDVSADLDWRRSGDAYVIGTPDLAVNHPGARARGSFEFVYERPGLSPILNMDLRVDDADVALTRRVLPYGHLESGSISWLEPAFLAGRVHDGRVIYRGPVRKFPFHHGEGEFVATAAVTGVKLNYFTGYAPLENGVGDVEFRNAGMRATLTGGEVGGLRVARAEGTIPDFGQVVLDVDASASGDLANALAVVQGSPLGPMLGAQFMQLAGQGRGDYAFRLHLPMHDPAQEDYYVGADLHGVNVSLPALRAPAQSVSGRFELHKLEMRAKSLRGTMLDGPFELDVEPGPITRDVNASVLLHGRGRVAGPRLPAFIGLPEGIRMTGGADWKLEARIERGAPTGEWASRYEVSSDLVGLGIAAPAPFAKEPSDARPTRVALDFPPGAREEVAVDSGSARARLVFVERDGRYALDRGIARFDGRPALLPDRPGLRVAGDWPDFDLGEWLELRSGASAGARLSDWLGPTEVHLDRARVLGFEFAQLDAMLQPQADAVHLTVSGPMAEGQVTIPYELDSGAPIRLDMVRLQLKPGAKAASESTGQSDPRAVPAVSIEAADFAWEDRKFGHVSAEIAKDPQGLRFRRLEARSKSFAITGSGAWLVDGTGSRTNVDLEVESTDLGATSAALGIPGALEAAEARAKASLAWPGGPSARILATMQGTLSLSLHRGQLRNVKPGAGRMLGLTSIAELPRRLALDFHDVTDAGLAFDTVKGDFEIRDGNAYTQNTLLKGAAVDIGIVGRTGLVAEDYDQTLVVSGNPSGPITVAGALAAGPIGAAGGLLISQIFKGQLQGLTRVYYRVTGPWANPVVERISAQASENAASETAQQQGEKR
ncbi:MAG: hypothetical protein FIB04_08850 [Gammaproteobacteria bacterium]|nr:hypothetical protein [Gammaproteobacteria bacterium]